MEDDYLKNCRFCLKYHEKISNLFLIALDLKNQVKLVDFLGKITDLTITKGEFLPDGICSSCVDIAQQAYSFVQQCIISHNILKKHETQREFRKIEQEALLEESEEEDQTIFLQQSHSKSEGENKIVPKSSKTELRLDLDNEFDNKFNSKIRDYTLENSTKLEESRGNISSSSEIVKLVSEVALDAKTTKFKEHFVCSPCNISFSNKIDLINHEKIHDATRPFRCSECPQTFFKQVHLAVHVRSHSKLKEIQFSCKFCGKHYMYEYLLIQHELKHSGEKPYPCPSCNKGCASKNSLKRHMVVHSESYNKKIHQCEICQKIFSYPSNLTEHMKIHTGSKPHLCPTCGKGFKQVGQLHVHQRIHSGLKPFGCTVCNEYFISRSKLKIHILKHTKEKPFVCEQCGLAFRQSYDLKMHSRTHTREKPVQCTVCSKRMATTGQLTVHLRTHTGERPYSCSICGKSFAINTTLVKHLRIHTGERPYKCDICSKDFNQASILKTHKKIHDSALTNSTRVKKKSDVRMKNCNNSVPTEDGGGSCNNLTLGGGATVRLAGVKQDVTCEDLIVCPAPIPLLNK